VAETDDRPLRADAQRNRDRLIEVALGEFTRHGPDATLDAIAKAAGVGPGTLYRHFPTRDALIEAVYRAELGRVCDAAAELLETLSAAAALRAWMDRFIDYMTTKYGMGDALRAVIASGGNPYAQSRERLETSIALLLDAGVAAGEIRADVTPGDVLAAIGGVALTAGQPDQREQAGRLLDLLMDGLRDRSAHAG
jgi:AcrR family transcriptional regulator